MNEINYNIELKAWKKLFHQYDKNQNACIQYDSNSSLFG